MEQYKYIPPQFVTEIKASTQEEFNQKCVSAYQKAIKADVDKMSLETLILVHSFMLGLNSNNNEGAKNRRRKLNYPRCFLYVNMLGWLAFLLSNLYCKLQYVK